DEKGGLGLVTHGEYQVSDTVQDQRPARPGLFTYIESSWNNKSAGPRRHYRRIVHPGPVIARLPVADFDIELERARLVGIRVRLEVVIAGPVLGLFHDRVTAVDAQGLVAVGGMGADHGAAAKGVAIFKGSNELDPGFTGLGLPGPKPCPAGIAAL